MAKLVGALVHNSADLVIATAIWTDLTFDSEDYDTDAIHSIIVNTDRLTCKTAGKYLIIASCRFDPDAAGDRQAQIRLNGITALTFVNPLAQAGTMAGINMSIPQDLAVNDYVNVRVYQSSGGNLNIDSGIPPYFSMHRIG